MDRWENKVAVVTGASFGIGAAIAKNLVECGLQVIGIARSYEKVEALAKTLNKLPGKLIARKVDMTKENEIIECFQWVAKNVGPVHILVNNAAVLEDTSLIDGDTEIWRKIVNTNILGYTIATREAIKIMKANNIDGHIVNINSILGHSIILFPNASLYGPTKYAITCYSDLLRMELVATGSKIKVSSVSPGFVDTHLFDACKTIKVVVDDIPKLRSEHVAQAVNFVLSTPPEVQIPELRIQCTGETY